MLRRLLAVRGNCKIASAKQNPVPGSAELSGGFEADAFVGAGDEDDASGRGRHWELLRQGYKLPYRQSSTSYLP
jgi:hypothetical protein